MTEIQPQSFSPFDLLVTLSLQLLQLHKYVISSNQLLHLNSCVTENCFYARLFTCTYFSIEFTLFSDRFFFFAIIIFFPRNLMKYKVYVGFVY